MTTRTPRSSARTVASHRRGSTLPTRNLRVRTKLALVLTIPLLGFLAVTGVQVASSVATATQLDDFSKQVALGREVTALVHELQRERDRTAGILASLKSAERVQLIDLLTRVVEANEIHARPGAGRRQRKTANM